MKKRPPDIEIRLVVVGDWFWATLWDLICGLAYAGAMIILFWVACIVGIGLLLGWVHAHP